MTTTTWRNWAGNQTADDVTIVHPETPDQVAGLVRDAGSDGRRVKAIGSGHSFTGIGRPEGPNAVQVVLDRLSGIGRKTSPERATWRRLASFSG